MFFTLLIIISQLVNVIMLNIKDQEAYILTELLEDLKEISEDHDLINPPISKTFNLKQKLIEKFGESITFHVVKRRLIVE